MCCYLFVYILLFVYVFNKQNEMYFFVVIAKCRNFAPKKRQNVMFPVY